MLSVIGKTIELKVRNRVFLSVLGVTIKLKVRRRVFVLTIS